MCYMKGIHYPSESAVDACPQELNAGNSSLYLSRLRHQSPPLRRTHSTQLCCKRSNFERRKTNPPVSEYSKQWTQRGRKYIVMSWCMIYLNRCVVEYRLCDTHILAMCQSQAPKFVPGILVPPHPLHACLILTGLC